jgi:hypothetical protein
MSERPAPWPVADFEESWGPPVSQGEGAVENDRQYAVAVPGDGS